jgi:hypothetical protein
MPAGLDGDKLADPNLRATIIINLKKAYEKTLGPTHPIKEVVIAQWIMQ